LREPPPSFSFRENRRTLLDLAWASLHSGVFLTVLLDALGGFAILVLVALGYSWVAWRALGRWPPRVLVAVAVAATLCAAALQAIGLGQIAGRAPVRPGAILAAALEISILYGAGFAGASVALWRRWKAPTPPDRVPLKTGLKGFFLGIGLPLLYVFGQELWMVIRP